MGRVFDGTCRLCGEVYTGTGISSHVKGCLPKHADIAAVHHGLLVGIRTDGPAGRFWMYVLVRPEASLSELDDFLRDLWFENDSTASGFTIEETQYLSRVPDEDPETDDVPVESMEVDLGAVMRPRMELSYTYDPRRPTSVELTVFDPYPCPESLVEGEETGAATLVARNDLDDAECSICGATADYICLRCLGSEETSDESKAEAEGNDGEDSSEGDDSGSEETSDDDVDDLGPLVCEECADRHDGELVELENTPRAGVRRDSESTSDE